MSSVAISVAINTRDASLIPVDGNYNHALLNSDARSRKFICGTTYTPTRHSELLVLDERNGVWERTPLPDAKGYGPDQVALCHDGYMLWRRIPEGNELACFTMHGEQKWALPLPPNVQILSVAPLFAEAIRSIHERTSISRLFRQ